ncbi:hypothetical protein, partial [Gorillibacterium massiliense]|uniref:hypothetical protein n=1 Tax=Gorillibacterium massiliense TaxID=1280390 RepID=UPI0005929BEB
IHEEKRIKKTFFEHRPGFTGYDARFMLTKHKLKRREGLAKRSIARSPCVFLLCGNMLENA